MLACAFAFAAATPEGGDAATFASAVRVGTDPKFVDYQANGCMSHRQGVRRPTQKRRGRGRGPGAVNLAPLAGTPEVAGPGFLNVRLEDRVDRRDAGGSC